MGFMGKTKNRPETLVRRSCDVQLTSRPRQSNSANHGFNLDCVHFSFLPLFLSLCFTDVLRLLVSVSPARVGWEIGFYFLNRTPRLTCVATFRRNAPVPANANPIEQFMLSVATFDRFVSCFNAIYDCVEWYCDL